MDSQQNVHAYSGNCVCHLHNKPLKWFFSLQIFLFFKPEQYVLTTQLLHLEFVSHKSQKTFAK